MTQQMTPIVVAYYDPRWPAMFVAIAAPVRAALGGDCVAIEHVGSTAVPGLAAKPIIELEVVVGSADGIPRMIAALDRLGYRHKGDQGVSGRDAFEPPRDSHPHHLYVVTSGAAELRRHVLFRNHLRSHPTVAQAYGVLKREIASSAAGNRIAYTNAKAEFVEAVLAEAERLEGSLFRDNAAGGVGL